ncbi:MAG: hypothetical protein LUQ60_03725 [Methanomicrobiales archaeon]|nr:hypothetical protein [Methanomicrobiales archaeon]
MDRGSFHPDGNLYISLHPPLEGWDEREGNSICHPSEIEMKRHTYIVTMWKLNSGLRGDDRLNPDRGEWSDERAHHLYSIATTSKDGKLRREALLFLGALQRAGSKDASWAMNSIKKDSKRES